MVKRASMQQRRLTIRVITADKYLFQKLRLEFPEWISISETDGEICLLDIDTRTAPEGAYTMSRVRACDISIPFRLGSVLEFIEEKLSDKAALTIDSDKRLAHLYGKEIRLTELEGALLFSLIEGGGEFISREALISRVFEGTDNSGMLNLYIHYLREKLEADGEKIIISSRKCGYKIDERFLSGKERSEG